MLSKTEIKEKFKALYINHFKIMLNICRNAADIPVIFHFLGSEKFGPKTAGLLGTVSSSISLYNLWGK